MLKLNIFYEELNYELIQEERSYEVSGNFLGREKNKLMKYKRIPLEPLLYISSPNIACIFPWNLALFKPIHSRYFTVRSIHRFFFLLLQERSVTIFFNRPFAWRRELLNTAALGIQSFYTAKAGLFPDNLCV